MVNWVPLGSVVIKFMAISNLFSDVLIIHFVRYSLVTTTAAVL